MRDRFLGNQPLELRNFCGSSGAWHLPFKPAPRVILVQEGCCADFHTDPLLPRRRSRPGLAEEAAGFVDEAARWSLLISYHTQGSVAGPLQERPLFNHPQSSPHIRRLLSSSCNEASILWPSRTPRGAGLFSCARIWLVLCSLLTQGWASCSGRGHLGLGPGSALGPAVQGAGLVSWGSLLPSRRSS